MQKSKDDINPLNMKNQEDIYGYLYGNYIQEHYFNFRTDKAIDKSILGNLYEICKSYLVIDKCRNIVSYIEKIKDYFLEVELDYEQKNRILRLFFLRISHYIRNISQTYFHYQGLQMILYFYAFTHNFFSVHDYPTVQSSSLLLKENELYNSESLSQGNNILKDKEEHQRSYASHFIIA